MRRFILFFSFVLLQGMGVAQGSFISMETKISPTLKDNTLTVKVDITNKGDEPAYNVQVGVDANDRVASTPVKDVLQINETHAVKTTFDMDIQTAGRYPLIVTIDYTDLNQYPFSAISSAYFVYKEDASPRVHGRIHDVSISKEGKLVLTLKNLLDTDKKVRVKLAVPRELSVSEPIRDVDLGSKSEKEITFDIKNFSALGGSSYRVFAVTGYEDNNKHFNVTIPGVVKIRERGYFLKTYKWVFIGAGAAIIAVFIGLQFGLPFLKKR